MNLHKQISIGYSPCPNDTFIFYGLMYQKVDLAGIIFEKPLLEDVETLNRWAMNGRLDVTKLSFHALGHVLDEYCILSAGSALGRGCGPLLVAAQQIELSKAPNLRVAIPGRYTTAALLFNLFLPKCTQLVEMRFDTIMEAVQAGEVDAGVIIHESRFTYEGLGLICLQDLGQWWEQTTGYPIPLGCIAARRSLGKELIQQIDICIKTSVQWGFDHPLNSLPYIRCHARELEEDVIKNHINLYVNDFSLDLGDRGMEAVEHLIKMGRDFGQLPDINKTVGCP